MTEIAMKGPGHMNGKLKPPHEGGRGGCQAGLRHATDINPMTGDPHGQQ